MNKIIWYINNKIIPLYADKKSCHAGLQTQNFYLLFSSTAHNEFAWWTKSIIIYERPFVHKWMNISKLTENMKIKVWVWSPGIKSLSITYRPLIFQAAGYWNGRGGKIHDQVQLDPVSLIISNKYCVFIKELRLSPH